MFKIKKNNGKIGIIALILFAVYIVLYYFFSSGEFSSSTKYILSLVGTIIYVMCMYTWYKKTNKIIDLYTIFITLFFLFNFGECFLWVFNIHMNSEIGYGEIFGFYIEEKNIILAQLFTVVCLLLFHCGAMFYICNTKNIEKIQQNNINEEKFKKNMKIFCSLLLLIVVPITYYVQYKKMIISTRYGYWNLFNDEFSLGYGSMLSRLFFPCIYALLFSSNFKKKTVSICYILIGIDFVMCLMIGSRGNIVYELMIILFLHNRYVKKITLKNAVFYIIGFFILMSIFSVIREIRDYGVNFEKISSLNFLSNNIVIKSIFEMGSSMGIQCILIQNGFYIYPYGNTYLLGLLGIVSEKSILIFNPNYIDLNTWFSFDYLKLNYGAGFTMVGEVLLNFGPYIGPIIMMCFGYLITKIITIFNKESSCKNSIFSLITFETFVMFIRGTFGYYIKYWFFSIVAFYGLFFIFSLLVNCKKGMKYNE